MKCLVQIPCFNEEEDIAQVIKSIPRKIPGIRQVKVLIIDDASRDDTVARAIAAGADLVISKKRNAGLADSFRIGQAFFLNSDFDFLVNTDGDNQYHQEHIPNLLQPLREGSADVVIADRLPGKLKHFHPVKRLAQVLGSLVISLAAGTKISDAASGFRAYSRTGISHLFITTRFSYAMETLIQAGNKGLRIQSIASGAKKVTRPSRLFRSSFEHVGRSASAILKAFLMYQPMKFFSGLGAILFIIGMVPMVRYLYLLTSGAAGQHLQSLIFGLLFLTASFLSFVVGLVAELSRIHRQLDEERISYSRLTTTLPSNAVLAAFGAALTYKK